MIQASDYELELMKIIWSKGNTAMYADIVAELQKKGENWTKNTIITLLSRLIDKGLLKIKKVGRRNKYIAVVTEADYQGTQTMDFIHKIFEGNTKGLISTLLQKDLLTQEDLNDLKQYWEGAREIHEHLPA